MTTMDDLSAKGPRKIRSVRLTDQEVEMAKKHGRSLSEGIRRLIVGPEPQPRPALPSFAEVLASGGFVKFSDGSGEFYLTRPGDPEPVHRESTIDHNYPAIRTAAEADVRTLLFWTVA